MNKKSYKKQKGQIQKHLIPHGRRTYLQGTAHLNKKIYNRKMKNKQSNKQKKEEKLYRGLSCV